MLSPERGYRADIDLSGLASRSLSRMALNDACEEFSSVLAKLGSECRIRGFYDLSASDVMNMAFRGDPRVHNLDYIPASVTIIDSEVDEIRLGKSSRSDEDDPIVIEDLLLEDLIVGEVVLKNVFIRGDFRIVNSSVDKLRLSDSFARNNISVERSNIGRLSVSELLVRRDFTLVDTIVEGFYFSGVGFGDFSTIRGDLRFSEEFRDYQKHLLEGLLEEGLFR